MFVGTCKGMTMERFAQQLRGIAGPYITSPVADQTGLKGYWDFDIRFTSFAVLGRAGSDGISLSSALEQQLGLSLERKQVPTPVTIVDSVSQKPTDNPSGVSASIPAPPPMEFDVAEITLSQPDAQVRTRLMPGGRIEADGVTMKMILQLAWDITMDELVAGAPKWFDETKYSIVAKTSTAVSGTGQDMNVDIDDLKAMLRALIVERFTLKTHEDRPVTAYALLADKPKLAKADPANRTGWKEGPAPDQQRMANGYIRVPVEDKTGLDGAYDFAFAFTPIGLLNGPGRGRGGDAPAAGPGGGAEASDPTGGVSLFDAVNRQLGLTLEMRKRPMPVLVIDHIEEKPTDN
jgi:uncharacterized protein (TIGR03435 family)